MTTFEPTMLGGASGAVYEKLRGDVDGYGWGTIQLSSGEARVEATRSWTIGAFLEHRAAAAASAMVQALIEARGPIDLVGAGTRIPADELAHAELSARLAEEIGGGIAIQYEPAAMLQLPHPSLSPERRAMELVVRYFCVAEAFSLPLVVAQRRAATQRLARSVFDRIVRDDAIHSQFGFWALDWALAERPELDLDHLAKVATSAMKDCVSDLQPPSARRGPVALSDVDRELTSIGILDPATYAEHAREALKTAVLQPLRERGIECEPPAGW